MKNFVVRGSEEESMFKVPDLGAEVTVQSELP